MKTIIHIVYQIINHNQKWVSLEGHQVSLSMSLKLTCMSIIRLLSIFFPDVVWRALAQVMGSCWLEEL